jgi:hypothetical protein
MKKFRIVQTDKNWYWLEKKSWLLPWWRCIYCNDLEYVERRYKGETKEAIVKESEWMW